MPASPSEAIISKARGMYAKHIRLHEYQDMMRRRTVPEVAAILKRHAYFGASLSTLSPTDPHREQIEELLSLDIFTKYELMLKYDQSGAGFSAYYLAECETTEILKALSLIHAGLGEKYLRVLPPYLIGKTSIDLYALGQAASFSEAVETMRHTRYYRVLRQRVAIDPALDDFAATEAALLRFYYAWLFRVIDESFDADEQQAVENLFLQEIELYNLNLIMRVKAYFPKIYSNDAIRELLMPYKYRIPNAKLSQMVEAAQPSAVLDILRAMPGASHAALPDAPEEFSTAVARQRYKNARRVMHMTASPFASMAAFLQLAKLERDNVVNVVEGVRYGMPPEKIQSLLEY